MNTEPTPQLPPSPPLPAPAGSVRLTGDAAFHAAVLAGVPVVLGHSDDPRLIIMTLAYPVDVWLDGGIIKVFSAPNA
jgi:hypothetical protein